MIGAARLGSWLPPSSGARRLLAASFVDSLGTGLFLAGSALFFTRVLGLTTVQVGVGLSLAGLAGFLGMVPVGRLADAVGGKRAIVALYLWRGCCFLAYPFVREPALFFVLAFLIGVAEWGGGPIVQGIIASVEKADARVRTMAVVSTVRNIGFTVGAVLATLAIATGKLGAFTGLVLADAGTFLAAAMLLSRLPAAAGARARRQPVGRSVVRVNDPRFLALTALNGVLDLHTGLLAVGLPLQIATRTAAPPAVIGVVVVINTVLVILLQVRLSRGSDGIRNAARRQQWASWSLAGCCLLVAGTGGLGGATATVLVIIAAVALTLGEIWQSVGAWGLSYALAPERQRAYYLSVFELGKSGSAALGPALLTWAVIRNGAVGWVGLAAVFVLTGLAVVLVSGGVHRALATPGAAPEG